MAGAARNLARVASRSPRSVLYPTHVLILFSRVARGDWPRACAPRIQIAWQVELRAGDRPLEEKARRSFLKMQFVPNCNQPPCPPCLTTHLLCSSFLLSPPVARHAHRHQPIAPVRTIPAPRPAERQPIHAMPSISVRGGVRIGYERHGTGPEHVLFVPGMCVSREMWRGQVAAFAGARYSLCLLDNRGVGGSDVPPAGLFEARGYAITALAADAWAVADAVFGAGAVVHVVGHSMGAMVAQRVALMRTARVASLSLLSGHCGGWWWSNVPTVALAQAAFDLFRTGFDERVAAEVNMRLHYTDRFLDELVVDDDTGLKTSRRQLYYARYLVGHRKDLAREGSGDGFWGHLMAVRTHDLSNDEARVLREAPFETLVLYGEHDAVVLPRASLELANRIGARAEPVSAAHFIIDEAQQEVNKCLTQHIARASRSVYPVDPIEGSFGPSWLVLEPALITNCLDTRETQVALIQA